jgi:hypothetical protein
MLVRGMQSLSVLVLIALLLLAYRRTKSRNEAAQKAMDEYLKKMRGEEWWDKA